MNKKQLISMFSEACAINSPSGKEGKMAMWIKKELEFAGWEVWTDNAGKKNGSDTGNVYSYMEVNPDFETVAFAAHMDTVAKVGDEIKIVFDGRVFKSGGQTILGADNKAGLVPLVYFGLNINKSRLKNNILLFFPTREEEGIMGSKFFSFKKSKIKYLFNLDGGEGPGPFVYKALGFLNFKIKVKGEAAHAAASYEKGRNAIVAAADLVKSLPVGKNTKKGTTLNIGIINGGRATNIVPDIVKIEGELRAFELLKMEELATLIKSKCAMVSKKYGVRVKFLEDADGSFSAPHVGSINSRICRVARDAAEKVGLTPTFTPAFYTTDANHFSDKGYQTIVVTRGGSNPHTNKEKVSLSSLIKTYRLIQELAYSS